MKKLFLVLVTNVTLVYAVNIADLPWIKGISNEQALHYIAPFLSEDPSVLEAGVCDAEDTAHMKRRWPNSRIYGFEPHPVHYPLAQRNIARFKLQGITLYPCALFDRVGTLTFYLSAKVPAASSLLSDNIDNVRIATNKLVKKIFRLCFTIYPFN